MHAGILVCGMFAFCEEGEIFFSVFFDFKEATVGTNIVLSQFVGTAFDRRATGTSDSQIVSFAHSTNSRDSSLDKLIYQFIISLNKLPLARKCWAKSEIPFSVKTRSLL